MRGSTVGAFALGFAAGVLVLGAAVWYRMQAPPAVAAVPMTDTGPAPLPPPLTPPTPLSVPPVVSTPPARGAADRIKAESNSVPNGAPHLAMPLAGMKPESLTESFYDTRDGRKHEALDIPAARGTPVLAVA